MKRFHGIGSVLFLVAFLTAVVVFAATPPETVKLEAKNGTVTFPHKMHAETLKLTCVTCHHKGTAENVGPACTTCHGKDEKAPSVMTAFHNKCKACHTQTNTKEGKDVAPTKCTQCHKKAETEAPAEK
jgi:cytochrome c553